MLRRFLIAPDKFKGSLTAPEAVAAVDALGRAIDSRYVLATTTGDPTAIQEMAATAGLWRLTSAERDPLVATTQGVGMQIAH